MFSGGELDWPIRTLIQLECQNAKAGDPEVCRLEVAKQTEAELKTFCESTFRKAKKIQKECQITLGQMLWTSPRDLKRKLKGRLGGLGDGLPPPLQSSFVLVKEQVRIYKQNTTPPPPPANEQTEVQREEDSSVPVVWEEKLALLDDAVTGSKFHFTHVDEWRRAETEVPWFYWLHSNNDGSHTLYWRMTLEENPTPPTPQDKQITFRLVNENYPENLFFQMRKDRSIRLILK